jgi:KRAB domain-containing zinc finger protein
MPKTQRFLPSSLVCGICAKSFLLESTLKTHIASAHFDALASDSRPRTASQSSARSQDSKTSQQADVQAVLKCEQCETTFSDAAALRAHAESEHGAANVGDGAACTSTARFVCTVEGCDKSYVARASLNNHIRATHDGRDYRCEQCGKRFSTSSSVRRHLSNVHAITPKVEFFCPIETCSAAFRHNEYLDKHLKAVHDTSLEYECDKCDECGQKFDARSGMRRHISAKHKPLQCHHCDMRFNSTAILNQHIERKHGRQRTSPAAPTDCAHCAQPHRTLAELVQHTMQAHPTLFGGKP